MPADTDPGSSYGGAPADEMVPAELGAEVSPPHRPVPTRPRVEWLLVKFLPDAVRREPRNVGLIVVDGDRRELRMLDAADVVALGADRANYEAWCAWFTHAVSTGFDLERLCSPRPGDSYVVERSGSLLLGQPGAGLADDLWARLVVAPAPHAGLAAQLRAALDSGAGLGELRDLASAAATALGAPR